MKILSSLSLKMNNHGGAHGRIFVPFNYHPHLQNQFRMKRLQSSNNGASDDNGSKRPSFEQTIVENLSSHSYQYQMETDFPTVAATRQELNRSFAKEISDMRKDLKSRRNWEYTHFGRLVGTVADQRTIGDGTRFFVMSYNILSQQLLSSHGNLYNGCDPRALNHSFRKQLLFSELDDIQPEILCLQEVEETDFYKIFEPTLSQKNYKGIYKKRTGEKSDGCAIFYKTTRFSFVDKFDVEYFQPHIPVLNRDNVALFIKLASHHYSTGRRQTFVVGTTHILFNPKRQDVKSAQVQRLLSEMDRFAFNGLDQKGNPTHVPVIMTGDFNADPNNPLMKSITESDLQAGVPPSHTEQQSQSKKNIIFSNVYAPRLDRSEGSQNTVTTRQTYWTTVDYIFYSKIWNEQYKKQTEGKLKLIRRLGLLTRGECKEMGPIPNLANSSDHFSLVAEFVLK